MARIGRTRPVSNYNPILSTYGQGGGPISFVGSSTANGSGVTSVSVSAPAGLANGDLIFIAVTSYGSTESVSATGFTNLYPQLQGFNTTAHKLDILYKFASSEPASWTVNFSTSTWPILVCYVMRGIDQNNPWWDAEYEANFAYSTTVQPRSVGAQEPTDARLFILGGVDSTGTGTETLTMPSGLNNPVVANNSSLGGVTGLAWGNASILPGTASVSPDAQDWMSFSLDLKAAPFTNAQTITGSDSGSGADVAGTVIVTASPGESGSGADNAAVVAQIPDSDTGVFVDNAQISVVVTGSDSFSGSESAVIVTQGSDSASGSDSAAVSAKIPASDAFSASEAGSLLFTSADSGTFVDNASIINVMIVSDAFSASDVAGTVLVGTGDTATASDTAFVPTAIIRASDTGSFAEAAVFTGLSLNDRVHKVPLESRTFLVDQDPPVVYLPVFGRRYKVAGEPLTVV